MSLDELPVRLAYDPGESLAGYIYRVYDANGHVLPEALVRAMNRSFAELQSLETLLQVVGSMETMRQAWRPIARLRRHAASASRQILSPPGRLAYCPACLRERQRHRQIWQIPALQACTEHGCLLVQRCQACGRRSTWRTSAPDWSCVCGAEFLEAEGEEADSHQLFIAALVRDGIGGDGEGEARDVYQCLAEGLRLLKRLRTPDFRDRLLEAARLWFRLTQDDDAVVAEIFDALHGPGWLFVPASRSMLRIIKWAEDISLPPSALREEMALALRKFMATYRVAAPMARTLLYAPIPVQDLNCNLQAFGTWAGCWGTPASSYEKQPKLAPDGRSWRLQDELIADIVLELHQSFARDECWDRHDAWLRGLTSERPIPVDSAQQVVTSLWAWLRSVPVLQLRKWLAELQKAASEVEAA